jgi:hypothetical protein
MIRLGIGTRLPGPFFATASVPVRKGALAKFGGGFLWVLAVIIGLTAAPLVLMLSPLFLPIVAIVGIAKGRQWGWWLLALSGVAWLVIGIISINYDAPPKEPFRVPITNTVPADAGVDWEDVIDPHWAEMTGREKNAACQEMETTVAPNFAKIIGLPRAQARAWKAENPDGGWNYTVDQYCFGGFDWS